MLNRDALLFLGVMTLGCAAQAERSYANAIDDLQPGHWYEVPNSKIRDVVPSPEPPGIQGPAGIVNAWNGGAYDTNRDRFIVWGGGHQAYGGNEVYTFDINTLEWTRAWGPSPSIPAPDNTACATTYSDGNPSSRHNYDGQEYIPPPIDKFWFAGGSIYCGGGNSARDAWWFDFGTLKWTQRASPPVSTFADLELVAAYDPVTGHVFFSFPNNPLAEYDPATNSWQTRGDQGPGYGRSAAAIDWTRRKLVAIGGGSLYFYTLNPSGTLVRQSLNTSGATEIVSGRPGLEYDPVSDRLVAWNGGQYVYTLNLDTSVWTKVSPAPTNTVVPTAGASSGTYGRFRYVPSKNVFIAVNSIDQNVFVYKLSPGTGTPTSAPAAPKNLQVR